MSDHNYTRQYTDLRSCGPVRADLAHAHGARRSGTSHSLAHGTRPMVHKWPTQGSAHIVHIQRLCLVNHRPPSTAYSSGAVVCTEATKRQRIEASKRQRATKPQSGKVAKWQSAHGLQSIKVAKWQSGKAPTAQAVELSPTQR